MWRAVRCHQAVTYLQWLTGMMVLNGRIQLVPDRSVRRPFPTRFLVLTASRFASAIALLAIATMLSFPRSLAPPRNGPLVVSGLECRFWALLQVVIRSLGACPPERWAILLPANRVCCNSWSPCMQIFSFDGHPGGVFNLLSVPNLSVNGLFDAGKSDDGQFSLGHQATIKQAGIRHHLLAEGPQKELNITFGYNTSGLLFSINGEKQSNQVEMRRDMGNFGLFFQPNLNMSVSALPHMHPHVVHARLIIYSDAVTMMISAAELIIPLQGDISWHFLDFDAVVEPGICKSREGA